jgi:hypothetical protein
MSLLAYRCVKTAVFGLMFFLAITASCSSDSYDPDPYDNLPPVITVDFNYVVPSCLHLRRPDALSRNHHAVSSEVKVHLASTFLPLALNECSTPSLQQGSPQLLIPLRR